MNVLLDTCAFLWLTCNSQRLSKNAVNVITDPKNGIHLSAVSIWEISTKFGRGRLKLSDSPDVFVPKHCRSQNFILIPFDTQSSMLAHTLPDHHRDPFDRMLIAHAIHLDMPIVTSDACIRAYPVKTIW